MATHYSCDRCGAEFADCGEWKTAPTVTVGDWTDNNARQDGRTEIVVTVDIYGPFLDGDGAKPDLCKPCKAVILRLAADRIEAVA